MALQRFRVAREKDSYVILELPQDADGVFYDDGTAPTVGEPFPFTAEGKGRAVSIATGLNAGDRRDAPKIREDED